MHTKVTAVILDIDGTLLFSNDEHAQAFVDAAQALRLPADFNTVRRLIGKGGDKLIPEAFGVSIDSEIGKKLDTSKGEIFRARYLPHLRPTPGARELLSRLRDDRANLIVATSANKEDVDLLLDRAGVRDLVHEIVSSDDVEASKPDPDIVQAAVEKSGEPAGRVVMLGDTPYDVEAALRAGIRIIGVRCGGWADDLLKGAAAVYADPADVLAHYEESPLVVDRVK
jgi:HAD superfamily hydrolase (TIGR01509 family)